MIINEGECIICESNDAFCNLIDLLEADGYKIWNGMALYKVPLKAGVRWVPGDGPFPDCLCYVPDEVKANLLTHGSLMDTTFSDHNVKYKVKRFGEQVANVEVNDLL